jgi:hypothetical protein
MQQRWMHTEKDSMATWASKKYRGHRILPDTIMEDLIDAGLVET